MTLNELPRWLMDWLLPGLPWLWVGVITLGLVLIVSRWFRWSSKTPACPVCRYDMRGSPGLSCPECGHTVKTAAQLLRRHPRRRWALWLGVLMMLGGPYVDLVQYRLLCGETVQRASVPTTVWILGYPYWPRTAEQVMTQRVFYETRRRDPYSGFIRKPMPRSDMLKYLFRQTGEVGYGGSPLPHWQTRLLARRSYTSMRSLQRKGMTTPYGHVVFFLMMSERATDDVYARERLVEGLQNNDPHIRNGCSGALKTLGVRVSPYVPTLEQRLRDLLIRGELDDANFRPKLYNNDAQELYDTLVANLETAIGKSGPAGMVVVYDWLGSTDPVLQDAALRMVCHNTDESLYTPELADRLVDILIDSAWHHKYHPVVGDVGLLAVNRAREHLRSGSTARRAEAIRILGVVFFDGPFYRGADIKRHRNSQPYYEAWAVRVDDPVYPSVLADITRMAQDEADEIVLERIALFMDKHRRIGTSTQRRYVTQMNDKPSIELMYERFR